LLSGFVGVAFRLLLSVGISPTAFLAHALKTAVFFGCNYVIFWGFQTREINLLYFTSHTTKWHLHTYSDMSRIYIYETYQNMYVSATYMNI